MNSGMKNNGNTAETAPRTAVRFHVRCKQMLSVRPITTKLEIRRPSTSALPRKTPVHMVNKGCANGLSTPRKINVRLSVPSLAATAKYIMFSTEANPNAIIAAYTTPSSGPSMSFFRNAHSIPKSFIPSSTNGADRTTAADSPSFSIFKSSSIRMRMS